MNELIHIENADISVKEYNGQRVVTFKDIDTVHSRPDGTARKSFWRNRDHFADGEDYFVLNMDEAQGIFNIAAPNGLALMTEQGYLVLVKPFSNDLSWEVQRQLVNGYFKVRKLEEDLSPQMKLLYGLCDQLAQAEREAKEAKQIADSAKETAKKAVEATENIKEAVKPVFDNWREEVNKKFNRIQRNADKPFNTLRVEMYSELEHRAGCDLATRLRNKKQ